MSATTVRSDDDLRGKLAQVEDDINQLRDERAEKVKARDTAKTAFAAIDGYDVESDEYKTVDSAVKSVAEVDEKLAGAQAAQLGILRMLGQRDPELKRETDKATQRNPEKNLTPWSAEGLLNEELRGELLRISTSKARFGSVALGEVVGRDAFKADISGTADMRLAPYYGILPQIFRPLRVLDLLPTGTMDNNVLPYTQEGGTFLAAETAEGSLKPEDGATFTDATAQAQTIAAWQKIRKQSLSDFAALRTIIETRLRYSVQRRLEAQVLNGNGTDPNLRGILNTTGIGSVTFSAGDVPAEKVLNGITTVYLADAEATGIVLHPTDWQTALLMKAHNTDGTVGSYEYIGGGPFTVTPHVMWGLPALPSPAIPQGTALVGDFSIGATLLIREGVNVLFSDSDQDDFLRNRVTLLGEMRAALPVWRPAAFCKVALQ